ncbi:META domain-containing protein [Nereida sp. MMG025]|uniref:META domain-containing protein n=1 Tax=Nereida sp. MMG025 TaxID=2909981 RepID=UPI001F2BC340|nr:META domain-containing protein [Nereida sp. MMG025]
MACQNDETLSAYGAAGKTWVLTELDGAAFPARATLEFPQAGELAGQAPCNRFFGAQTVPYPWFKAENIAATKMACPDLPAEGQFLTALSEMTLSEVLGDTMILSNDAGREMVFKAR